MPHTANVHTGDIGKRYPNIAVAILAGGESRRFGSDKANYRLVPDGPTLLERSVATGQRLSDLVVVIGHKRYESSIVGVPIVPDAYPGAGPLGGIATALQVLDRPRVLILGCDMPCLSDALLRWMIALESKADVLVPRTDEGHWQTMHAIYARTALPTILRSLTTGNRAVSSVFDHVIVESVSENAVRALDPALDSFVSTNKPEDIDRARRCVEVN